MGYVHPGRLFTQQYGLPQTPADVLRYAAFLRAEAGLSDDPPIDLARIYLRFDIPTPRKADLQGQQGLLLNPESGLIIVNENDLHTRQRFTEAHELLELLFSQVPGGNAWSARGFGRFKPPAKERLCNQGAAELLMPSSSFLPRLKQHGVSIPTALQLAVEYQVSATAAMVNMARVGPGEHAVVVWRHKLKQSEEQRQAAGAQISLFGGSRGPEPVRQLRVEWAIGSDGGGYIPRDKAVPEGTSIHRAWAQGVDTTGEDLLELGQVRGRCRCESHPFEVEGERQVISLLHLPGDWCHLEDPDEVVPF